ncbi:MAG TPA: hypothetical protein VHX86_17075 [Tepidisphaeraceae bacterium]|jgi:uncharacterized protein involved in outer membrane biogenesis|nr:hypothetical protein [Tepidisphaeraceae bacterium]
MKILQETIERKLSRLLGRRVTFQRLNVSPLAGRLDAEGMMVAGEKPDRPLLSVAHISATIAVTKALAGQIVIKSLQIDSPAINLVRRGDGSFDVPHRNAGTTESDEDKAGGWQLEAQSIRIVSARVSFEDRTGGSVRTASAEQITGELNQSAGRMDFNFRVGAVGRRDPVMEFGPLQLSGQTGGIKDFATSPLRAQLQFADGLRMSMDSPSLSALRSRAEQIFTCLDNFEPRR